MKRLKWITIGLVLSLVLIGAVIANAQLSETSPSYKGCQVKGGMQVIPQSFWSDYHLFEEGTGWPFGRAMAYFESFLTYYPIIEGVQDCLDTGYSQLQNKVQTQIFTTVYCGRLGPDVANDHLVCIETYFSPSGEIVVYPQVSAAGKQAIKQQFCDNYISYLGTKLDASWTKKSGPQGQLVTCS